MNYSESGEKSKTKLLRRLCDIVASLVLISCKSKKKAIISGSRAAEVHLNLRAGSIFPVPVSSAPSFMDWTSRCNKVDAVRLYASYRINLLLLKGQRCVGYTFEIMNIFILLDNSSRGGVLTKTF